MAEKCACGQPATHLVVYHVPRCRIPAGSGALSKGVCSDCHSKIEWFPTEKYTSFPFGPTELAPEDIPAWMMYQGWAEDIRQHNSAAAAIRECQLQN